MKPFRIALIGAGKITAGSHLPAALALPQVEVAAIVDRAPDRAAAAAATWGRVVPHAARVEDVIGRIDGAIVATPNHTHHAIAKTLLEAGVATLVEKPLAETAEEADELAAIAGARGVVLTAGYCTRFSETFAVVREALASGRYGAVESFSNLEGSLGGWSPLDGYSRGKAGGGGVLTVTGTHFLDRMTAWFGRGAVLSYADDGEGGPEANCIGLMEFRRPDGAPFRGRFQFSKTSKMPNTTVIRTSAGVITVGNAVTFRAHGAAVSERLEWPGAFRGYLGQTNFERQIEDFVAAARGERPAAVSAREAAAQIALVSALYAARVPLNVDWRRGEAA